MTNPRGQLDPLLDLCLFAPVGFLMNARSLVPDLAAKGREQLDLQVRIARMLGQFAVAKGQEEAGNAVQRLRGPRPAAATRPAAPPRPVPARSAAPAPSLVEEEVIPVRVEDVDPVTVGSVGADELAIPEYDSLAASQVLPRLDGLTADELEAVRRYEAAHRSRKTVLGKIAQLQSR